MAVKALPWNQAADYCEALISGLQRSAAIESVIPEAHECRMRRKENECPRLLPLRNAAREPPCRGMASSLYGARRARGLSRRRPAISSVGKEGR